MVFTRCFIECCLTTLVSRRDVGVVLQQQPHRALMTIQSCQVANYRTRTLALAAMSAFFSSSSLTALS
eukprot:CAMPEP_0184403274 /NCGR_PEP_ID=MMETSP0007-20130409/85323_1 /TAXON_ID=97485 /ORGANISM="Prymnesium parvum, Strain Texoma1" /LENGTH=67 /DNA_ID=CAMNT_0026759363 /DNA_START=516 /DNA_END=719 /DNA_ORIENTATION=-